MGSRGSRLHEYQVKFQILQLEPWILKQTKINIPIANGAFLTDKHQYQHVPCKDVS